MTDNGARALKDRLAATGIHPSVSAAILANGAVFLPDAGTTTECPLAGVHEHAFRGPHRFREWEPEGSAGTAEPLPTKCALCGEPHLSATSHDHISLQKWESGRAKAIPVKSEYQRFYDFVAESDPALVDAWHFTENARSATEGSARDGG